jgi:hypothetical protein
VAPEIAAEIDRQLAAQRAQVDSFATRAGVLLAATSLLTGLLSKDEAVPSYSVWLVGVSSALGVLVLLLSRLTVGPSTSQIATWAQSWNALQEQALLDSKLVAIESNQRAALRTEGAFVLQALLTAGSVTSIVIHAATVVHK